MYYACYFYAHLQGEGSLRSWCCKLGFQPAHAVAPFASRPLKSIHRIDFALRAHITQFAIVVLLHSVCIPRCSLGFRLAPPATGSARLRPSTPFRCQKLKSTHSGAFCFLWRRGESFGHFGFAVCAPRRTVRLCPKPAAKKAALRPFSTASPCRSFDSLSSA